MTGSRKCGTAKWGPSSGAKFNWLVGSSLAFFVKNVLPGGASQMQIKVGGWLSGRLKCWKLAPQSLTYLVIKREMLVALRNCV